eukprot:Gb_33639 [translate_table: standard]
MKLTCLNPGKNNDFPACHLLQMCGVRILLECPLDLSSLQLFLPVDSSSSRKLRSVSFSSDNFCSDDLSRAKKQRKIKGTEDVDEMDSPFKYCEGSVLIDAEPWYKTADLHLWDLSLIEVVLISNPSGMLGLPFLTRNKNFSAKVSFIEFLGPEFFYAQVTSMVWYRVAGPILLFTPVVFVLRRLVHCSSALLSSHARSSSEMHLSDCISEGPIRGSGKKLVAIHSSL